MKNTVIFFLFSSIGFIGCSLAKSLDKPIVAASYDKGTISADDWVEMTQKIALWSGIVTYLLDTNEMPARIYDDGFINDYFDETIATDFEGWTVKSPFGEKHWKNKDTFLDVNKGYAAYNAKFANNAEHTITTPVIISKGSDKALMYVNILNRTVDRLESDNSVPMWKTNIYWQKKSGKWRITKGVAFYNNPKNAKN